MNELLEALILGIVQGLTEFLPVSSSGHIELFRFIMNDDSVGKQSLLTTVFLHFATALATIVVFRSEVKNILIGLFSNKESQSFSIAIIISMIPAAVIGIAFDDIIESFFDKKLAFVGAMLIVTALLLFLSERLPRSTGKMTYPKSFIIGISQAIAILPGISRSGATIATSLLLGITKERAARFSFLMVIPLIFGKMGKDLLSGDFVDHMPDVTYLIIGFIAAFLSGIFACNFMIAIVKNAQLKWFAYYCFLIGAFIIIYTKMS